MFLLPAFTKKKKKKKTSYNKNVYLPTTSESLDPSCSLLGKIYNVPKSIIRDIIRKLQLLHFINYEV